MTRRNKAAQSRKTKSRVSRLPSTLFELPVVRRCRDAYVTAYNETLEAGKSEFSAEHAGRESYRTSMPAPLDFESTRDFIACITNGVLTDIFNLKMATSLYYAAQIALSLHRNTSGQVKKA